MVAGEKNGANGIPKKIKFLFVSIESLSGDLAYQIKKEGHDVKVYIKAEEDRDVYEGFLEKVDDWEKHKDWADVIVFDDVGFGGTADRLRKEGRHVVGGSTYTDKLELNREFGQAEMKHFGVNVAESWNFTDFEAAIKFLKEKPGRYVMKPSGAAQDEKELLFIGEEEDGKDLIEVLQHNKKSWARKIKTFQIQEFISAGVEVAAGAFFNGKDFIQPLNINFEHKRLFPGDIGPFTGEMGTLMYWSQPNTIFNTTLAKMKDALAQSGYVGYIDINCIANSRGIYPLEFTARFGYPTISIQMEGILTPMGEFLYKLSRGENFELKTKKGFQLGVVVVIPPFPFDDKKMVEVYKDSSILFKKPNMEGVHLGEVKLVEGDWKIAGVTGYALVITGSGSTVDEARKQAYKRVENIMLQNMFYRVDIGEKWFTDSDRLQTCGYLY